MHHIIMTLEGCAEKMWLIFRYQLEVKWGMPSFLHGQALPVRRRIVQNFNILMMAEEENQIFGRIEIEWHGLCTLYSLFSQHLHFKWRKEGRTRAEYQSQKNGPKTSTTTTSMKHCHVGFLRVHYCAWNLDTLQQGETACPVGSIITLGNEITISMLHGKAYVVQKSGRKISDIEDRD